MTNEMKVLMLERRKELLAGRDPVGNANIIHKIERKIRMIQSK